MRENSIGASRKRSHHSAFRQFRYWFLLALLVIAALTLWRPESIVPPTQAVSTGIVISQVYGGGGNAGSTFKNDFIELFNRGTSPVNVTGWSVQYTSAAATAAWQVTNLNSFTIQPGQYYLVQEAQGAGGTTNLPTPDATGTIPMSLSSANVALVNNTTALAIGCPAAASVVDLVGYGSSATCRETSPTTTLTNTTAAIRNNNGCTDTDNNSADFTAGAPNPRNSASLMNPCGSGGPTITNSSPLPNGTVGAPYSVTFTASGGSGSGYTFSQTAGTLPPGLTLSGAVLSGTPNTTTGSPFSFTIQATDSASNTGSKVFQLTVLPPNSCPASSPVPQGCGVERWSVKTGTDADVGLVNLNSATPTTLASLHSLPSPDPTPVNNRVAPGETTQWIVNGTLVEYKLESDSDYHVVVQDGAGNTMVTEIPYPGNTPACVSGSSPFLPGITNARCKFDSSSLPQATTSFQFANVPVRITGVGMFDFPHGQTGASPNQIEIHPILDIAFPTTANATTNPGSNVNVQAGDASVTFSNVSGGGTTTAMPIDPSSAGTPPAGDLSTGPALDISTTATVTGPINVCINVPYITDSAAFDKLRLLHLEGGTLIDRTTGKNAAQKIICGSLPSLSPVVVAVGNSPTAADSFVTGRITTTDGDPLAGVTVTLDGSKFARAVADQNGLYSFANLETGGFYNVTPELANHTFSPSSRSFSLVGSKTDATFTASETGPTANPLDEVEFFVRQQYVDMLAREPDQGGLDYWSAQVRACGSDTECVRSRRIGVSAAFFVEQEFQNTGFFIYRMYKAAFGKAPSYLQYSSDHVALRGGPNLDVNKFIFADNFVRRNEFTQIYPDSLSNYDFVNKLFDSAGILFAPFERRRFIDALNGGASRGWVLDQVIEEDAFKQSQYNSAFVLSQYFGYLRRDPDQRGYDFWLDILNNREPGNYRAMVCGFITSAEYQRRFGPVVTHSNSECGG